MKNTAMCWGFDCGDGWFLILLALSEKLERLILARPEDERENFRAVQVKEKYGTLRFYMSFTTDEMDKAIHQAELETDTTCEVCGRPGELRERKRWFYTACEEHVTK
jgi:hypothetical protein